jgi:hypothetical protein
MRIFFSEHNNNYVNYTFDYAVYADAEVPGDFPKIFDMGFLPYSFDVNLTSETFYLCRSVRVDTAVFKPGSENKRVDRKLEPLGIQVEVIEKAKFNYKEPEFQDFCLQYADQRYSAKTMDLERLNYIFERLNGTHFFKFTDKDGKLIGYVLAGIHGNMLHYWFSYFDTYIMTQYPVGKWMMWKLICWAQENGLAYVYLGTCYGEKALYKVRDFNGVSFFDGEFWNPDLDELKSRCKNDHEPLEMDRFKMSRISKDYISGEE